MSWYVGKRIPNIEDDDAWTRDPDPLRKEGKLELGSIFHELEKGGDAIVSAVDYESDLVFAVTMRKGDVFVWSRFII